MPRKTSTSETVRRPKYGFNEAAARCRGKHTLDADIVDPL